MQSLAMSLLSAESRRGNREIDLGGLESAHGQVAMCRSQEQAICTIASAAVLILST
jgi:hypothetical protein